MILIYSDISCDESRSINCGYITIISMDEHWIVAGCESSVCTDEVDIQKSQNKSNGPAVGVQTSMILWKLVGWWWWWLGPSPSDTLGFRGVTVVWGKNMGFPTYPNWPSFDWRWNAFFLDEGKQIKSVIRNIDKDHNTYYVNYVYDYI